MAQYSIGLDFGTNSVRCLIVDCSTGDEAGTAIVHYPSGEAGLILNQSDPHLARQHPGDYTESLKIAVRNAVKESGIDPSLVVGIGVDTTGSSPIPVDESGVPLGVNPAYKDNPASQCWLWKDHTSYAEAAEITKKAQKFPYLAKCGGTYSSEWFWSKILHCARTAPEIFEAAHSWVECQDYIPAWLVGNTDPKTLKRGVCAAGHKAMYSEEWGGLPSKEFLAELDPRLADLRDRLYDTAVPSDHLAGHLCAEVAAEIGLPAGIPVAVGAFDAHMGAVGSGVKEGTLVKIMGTSTCDIMVGESGVPDIEGVCGIVPGSVIPGMVGIEAGQSAVGDLFNWFAQKIDGRPDAHERLSEEALKLKPGESGLVALDWHNGNRTVLVDPLLTGLIIGQTLATTKAEIYRCLIEGTAFGALRIIQQIENEGVPIREIVVCGGIAEKSPLAMQIYADVCNRPILISRSTQTCALGAAMFGAVVGGVHKNVNDAVGAMTGFSPVSYSPIPANVEVYAKLYRAYLDLHDAFGNTSRTPDLHQTMKDLLAIQKSARS